MENTNYGISPDEEMSTIMKDIEQNIQNQKPDEESLDQEDPLIETLEDEEGSSNLDDEDKEEEPVNAADLFREKYYLEKKKRKNIYVERQQLAQENSQLKSALDGTLNNNAELYGRELYNDLEKIKSIKKQAMLGAFGDPEDPDYYRKNADILAEAEDLYQKASYKINEFENTIANRTSNVNNNGEFEDEENYNEQIKLSKAQEWVSEHPELQEGSYKYNPKIQKELGSFIEGFDRELKRSGREDEILSDAYLDVLDEFVDSVKIKRSQDGYTTSNVGGVRNNFSNGASNSIKVTLTEFDKNYAKNLGISEIEYLKYKIEDVKESRIKSR